MYIYFTKQPENFSSSQTAFLVGQGKQKFASLSYKFVRKLLLNQNMSRFRKGNGSFLPPPPPLILLVYSQIM